MADRTELDGTKNEMDTRDTEVEMSATGWWLWTILFVAIGIAIAFWPARVAGRKGHSFFGYFIFSLIFFLLR